MPPQAAAKAAPVAIDADAATSTRARREELSAQERKRIDETFARLETETHYQLLGVGMGATARDLEKAHAERVSVFDPARHRNKDLGAHAERLETVFARLCYAYEILSTPSRRCEYDEYLALREATRYLEAAIVVPPSRAPSPDRHASGTPSAPRVAFAEAEDGGSSGTPSPAPEPASPSSARQRSAQSLQDLRRVLQSGRNAPERHPCIAAAERAFAEGQWVSALNAARVALSLEPDNGAMRALHDAASAKAAAEQVAPYRSRASYEEEKGDWEAAARSHQRVAEGSPGDAKPLLKAAECLLRAGTDPRAAVRLARAAVALSPDVAGARLTLARAYESAGSTVSAIGELQRALALTPGDATIAPWLARLQGAKKLGASPPRRAPRIREWPCLCCRWRAAPTQEPCRTRARRGSSPDSGRALPCGARSRCTSSAIGTPSARSSLRSRRRARTPCSTGTTRTALELKDARLRDASRRANQRLCAEGRQAKATKLLRAVAEDLRSLDWDGIRPVTRDFVVYVTRLEGDGYRDVRREAPPAVLRSLVRRGLL